MTRLLGVANSYPKGNQLTAPCVSSKDDRSRQLIVDVVSGILDGNGTAAPAAGDHRDGLACIAAKGKQKAIQLFVIRVDPLHCVLLAFFCAR